MAGVLLDASAGTTAASRFVHWGVVQISLANLLIILVMIAVFVLALVVPFPGGRRADSDEETTDERR
jgi:hypothetical protein